MNKRIECYKQEGWWFTFTLEDGKPSLELKRLFGTAIIPTPFKDTLRASQVVSTLKELNPEAEVVVVEKAVIS
jgi:hypothetical protein